MNVLKSIPFSKPSPPTQDSFHKRTRSNSPTVVSPLPQTATATTSTSTSSSSSSSSTSTAVPSLKIPLERGTRKSLSPPKIVFDPDKLSKPKSQADEDKKKKANAKEDAEVEVEKGTTSTSSPKGKITSAATSAATETSTIKAVAASGASKDTEPKKAKAKEAPKRKASTKGGQRRGGKRSGGSQESQKHQLKRSREEKAEKGPRKKKQAQVAYPEETLENKDLIRGLAHKTTDKYGRSMYNYLIQSMNIMWWKPASAFPNELINAFENSIYYDGRLTKCPNPKCTKRVPKLSQSKYCSEACALEVARQRLRMRLRDYKAGDNGDTIPVITPDSPPLPARVPVVTHFKRDGTVASKPEHVPARSMEGEISAHIDALTREKAVVAQYKASLEEKVALIKAHVEAIQKSHPVPSSQDGYAEGTKVAKSSKEYDCPICGKSLPEAAIAAHFPRCRKRKEVAAEWPCASYEPVDTRIYCGAEVKLTGKQRLAGLQSAMYCRNLKYSCPFHTQDIVGVYSKKPAEGSVTLPVCGYPFEQGKFCLLPPDDCPHHMFWYPFTMLTLNQQLCSISAWMEDIDEEIGWLNSCIRQQRVKMRKLREMEDEPHADD